MWLTGGVVCRLPAPRVKLSFSTDSTQHGDLPRTENDGRNSWKRLRSSLGLARDDDDRIDEDDASRVKPRNFGHVRASLLRRTEPRSIWCKNLQEKNLHMGYFMPSMADWSRVMVCLLPAPRVKFSVTVCCDLASTTGVDSYEATLSPTHA